MRHIVIAKTLFALLALSAGPAAHAQMLDNEITPYLGYRTGGTFDATNIVGRYEISDSDSYGLIVNFMSRNQTQFELIYARQETDADFLGVGLNDPDVGLDLQTLELGGIYEFDGQMFRPYVAGTVGGTYARSYSAEKRSDTFLSGSFGLGVKFRPEDRFGARLEVRLRGVLLSSNSSLFCSTGTGGGGCSVAISGSVLTQVETFAGVSFRF